MKNKIYISTAFWVITFVLSNVMCATVAYNYCNMLWSIKYKGASAPATVAFVWAIPYLIGIIITVSLGFYFQRKSKQIKD